MDPSNPSKFFKFAFEEDFLIFSPAPADDIINPNTGFLDYALLKIKPNQQPPIGAHSRLNIGADHHPSIGEPVFIIQFPGGAGGQQKVALVDNEVISEWDHYLYYEADTKEGQVALRYLISSWEVVGLHHYGSTRAFKVNSNGTESPANRGIYIKVVLEDIRLKQLQKGLICRFKEPVGNSQWLSNLLVNYMLHEGRTGV